MRIVVRLLIHVVAPFLRALFRGEAHAVWTVVGIAGLIALFAFVQFARRPLGGDPEKPPVTEDDFLDAKNPYRDLDHPGPPA